MFASALRQSPKPLLQESEPVFFLRRRGYHSLKPNRQREKTAKREQDEAANVFPISVQTHPYLIERSSYIFLNPSV